MTIVDLTVQEHHMETLRELLIRDDGVEAAAYVLCGKSRIGNDPWDQNSRTRLTSYQVLPIPPEDMVSASERHVTWSTASFVRLLQRAADDGLVTGIVHTHPDGPGHFSTQDYHNERELARLARNRNGEGTELLSMLLVGAGEIRARLWTDLQTPVEVTPVRVVGQHLAFHGALPDGLDLDPLVRQERLWGPGLNARLRTLKIGVVGCGGTGSATAMLLAHLGVGQLILFDEDGVEVSNLNRLHGARRADADARRPKVEVLAREIAALGLGTRVTPIRAWIGDSICRDGLKACDIIFGCTDDHDGRLLLNRLAYFYLIPVIDMGLAIDPAVDTYGVRDLSGRVTVLIPDAPCLMCRGIVNPVAARDEELRRQHPEEYERRKREAYVRGGGDPAPSVVTFTTATACLAIDEMLQGLTCFRGPEGWAWQRTRRFDLMQDRRPGAVRQTQCPVCFDPSYWGRGDIEPFLDRTG